MCGRSIPCSEMWVILRMIREGLARLSRRQKACAYQEVYFSSLWTMPQFEQSYEARMMADRVSLLIKREMGSVYTQDD
jgi:hypothetical protein